MPERQRDMHTRLKSIRKKLKGTTRGTLDNKSFFKNVECFLMNLQYKKKTMTTMSLKIKNIQWNYQKRGIKFM